MTSNMRLKKPIYRWQCIMLEFHGHLIDAIVEVQIIFDFPKQKFQVVFYFLAAIVASIGLCIREAKILPNVNGKAATEVNVRVDCLFQCILHHQFKEIGEGVLLINTLFGKYFKILSSIKSSLQMKKRTEKFAILLTNVMCNEC